MLAPDLADSAYSRESVDSECLETYEEEVLAPSEQRLNEQDNPPTLEELQEIKDRVRAQASASIRQALDDPKTVQGSAAAEYLGDTELGSVRLGDDFRAARAPGGNTVDEGYDIGNLPKPSCFNLIFELEDHARETSRACRDHNCLTSPAFFWL